MGAAIQAGIYEGTIQGLAVMDVWQAALARAFAADRLADGGLDEAEPESDPDPDEQDLEGV